MSQTARVRLLVALAAVAAAAAVAGVVYATRQDPPALRAQCARAPKPFLVPGVEGDVAAVRAALALPARQAARTLQPLARTRPQDAVVQFNFATAAFCAGYVGEAEQAFRQAKRAGRDTYYEIQSDVILHPQFFDRGYPLFESTSTDPLLVQGALQQRRGHQRSAERLFARAARLRPGNDEAQVAAAVARFDMDDLASAFSRLGPLTRRFPRSQSVRYHLGLLLAWTGQRDEAIRQFRLARALGPRTPLGKQAAAFLSGLVTGGTSGAAK